MKPLTLVMLALLLSGCATSQGTQVVDTYCITAKKRTWDPDVDSIETMRGAVIHNRAIDRRCGIPGKA